MRIRGHLDDISRLKKPIPSNAALIAEELDSITRDRQRAQEEFTVRSYDWETEASSEEATRRQYKKRSFIEFERMLNEGYEDTAEPDRVPEDALERGGRRKPLYEPI